MLAVIRYGSNNTKAYFRFALIIKQLEQNNVVFINQHEIIYLTCMYFFKIQFLYSIHTCTTHSVPIQLTFTKDKNMLSLLYGAFAEILRSNITPHHHRNTTAILP